MGCLYKLTSPSGKSYIGITSKTLEKRWAKHVEHALGKRDAGALYAALRKYGPESFVRVQLAECADWKQLCEMERAAIAEHGTLSPNGYNLTIGGEGVVGPLSEKARRAISIAQKRRFADPVQRALLAARSKAGMLKHWAGHVKAKPKSKSRNLSKEQHAALTRAGMARPEVHAKVLAYAQRRAQTPGWREKISASKTGKAIGPASEQRKQRIAEARKREWADPVMREKRLSAFRTAREQKQRNT